MRVTGSTSLVIHSATRPTIFHVQNVLMYVNETEAQLDTHRDVIHDNVSPSNAAFECPTCNLMLTSPKDLQDHIEEVHEQLSRLSQISEASSSSWMFVHCKICNKKFHNEYDVSHHQVRVHEYGELCEMYPCEDCGYSAQDLVALDKHRSEHHGPSSTSMEELGITKLPEYSKRIKQNFNGLIMDSNGVVEAEESNDEYVASDDDDDTEKLLVEDEDIPNFRNNRKRKAIEEKQKQNKKTKSTKQSGADKKLSCETCSISFSRKDNLSRHIRNKHS